MGKKIKFNFDPSQEHQRLAVESVVKLFGGLQKFDSGFQMVGDDTVANVPPYYEFNENWLKSNVSAVQESNKLALDMDLWTDDGLVLDGVQEIESWRFPAFTIEMETGTGKTYAYIRTIHELRKHYGFRKFIIVVPSIAIFEGTIKTFEMTKEHFKTLYGNEPVHLTRYDGQQISKIRSFANSTFTEIIVITLDSFNRSSNILYKASEKLPGEKRAYHYIQESRPILILDESQNYNSELSRKALRTLHPLFAVNYSATPGRTKPNLVYRLSPVDAFRMNLVKKIQVIGVKEEYNVNDPQLSLALQAISAGPYGLSAKFRTLVNVKGVLTEKDVELRKNDILQEKTKNENHRDIVVESINKRDGVVLFTNGEQLTLNDSQQTSLTKEEVFKFQIEETIKQHIARQNELHGRGIKVLSLFFIDRVANYTDDKGIIKMLFDKAFEKYKGDCKLLKNWRADEVRDGYFASKKNKKGEIEFVDTELDDQKKSKEQKESEKVAYEKIMRNKEALLDFNEKVCFIFAHSALREGWDNPNVFQICTLNQTISETRKRQEIGRGLRLCRDKTGAQVKEEGINILTVIANESYHSYVENLQREYIESGDVAPPPPSNARKTDAKRNNKVFKSKDFQEFWNKLCKRTSYTINMHTETLIDECIARINKQEFPEPQVAITKGTFAISDFLIELLAVQVGLVRLKIEINDTDGNSNSSQNWYKLGSDLAKIAKDDRFKGYKIVDVKFDGKDSIVYFGDKGELTMGSPIRFQIRKGVQSDPRKMMQSHPEYPVPNLIDRTSKETQLTKPTVLKIFKGLRDDKKEYIFKNPEGFTSIFITQVNNQLANHIAEKIEYELSKDVEEYDIEKIFPSEKKFPQKELLPGTTNSLYDLVQIDSDVEKRFVLNRLQPDDAEGKIICYFKFPGAFKISIPKIIGNYNPDWGIIRLDESGNYKLQLVRETKGNMDPNLLQYPSEKRKIDCANKHFAKLGVDYRQVTDTIPNWWKPDSTKHTQS
jgi:type III restriction enzyme